MEFRASSESLNASVIAMVLHEISLRFSISRDCFRSRRFLWNFFESGLGSTAVVLEAAKFRLVVFLGGAVVLERSLREDSWILQSLCGIESAS